MSFLDDLTKLTSIGKKFLNEQVSPEEARADNESSARTGYPKDRPRRSILETDSLSLDFSCPCGRTQSFDLTQTPAQDVINAVRCHIEGCADAQALVKR